MNNENPHQPDNSFSAWPYYRPAGEVPFLKNGKRYLFVRNQKDRREYVYDYADDVFVPYAEVLAQ